jgi:hypothetical protein
MKALLITIIVIAIIYLGVGTFAAWALSSAGGEKFSFNNVTFKFIATWPRFLFRGKG